MRILLQQELTGDVWCGTVHGLKNGGVLRRQREHFCRSENTREFAYPSNISRRCQSKTSDQSRRGSRNEASGSSAGPRPEFGSDLVLRNLADGSEHVFADVVEYTFARDAKALVYAVGSKTKENNGVFFVAPGFPAESKAVLKGKGKNGGNGPVKAKHLICFCLERG